MPSYYRNKNCISFKTLDNEFSPPESLFFLPDYFHYPLQNSDLAAGLMFLSNENIKNDGYFQNIGYKIALTPNLLGEKAKEWFFSKSIADRRNSLPMINIAIIELNKNQYRILVSHDNAQTNDKIRYIINPVHNEKNPENDNIDLTLCLDEKHSGWACLYIVKKIIESIKSDELFIHLANNKIVFNKHAFNLLSNLRYYDPYKKASYYENDCKFLIFNLCVEVVNMLVNLNNSNLSSFGKKTVYYFDMNNYFTKNPFEISLKNISEKYLDCLSDEMKNSFKNNFIANLKVPEESVINNLADNFFIQMNLESQPALFNEITLYLTTNKMCCRDLVVNSINRYLKLSGVQALENYIETNFKDSVINKRKFYEFNTEVFLEITINKNFIFFIFFDSLNQNEKIRLRDDLKLKVNREKELLSCQVLEDYFSKNYKLYLNNDTDKHLIPTAITLILKDPKHEIFYDAIYFNDMFINNKQGENLIETINLKIKKDFNYYYNLLIENENFDNILPDLYFRNKFTIKNRDNLRRISLNYSTFSEVWGEIGSNTGKFKDYLIRKLNEIFSQYILEKLCESLHRKIDELIRNENFISYIENTNLITLSEHLRNIESENVNFLYQYYIVNLFENELGNYETICSIQEIKLRSYAAMSIIIGNQLKDVTGAAFKRYVSDTALKITRDRVYDFPLKLLEGIVIRYCSGTQKPLGITEAINFIFEYKKTNFKIPLIPELDEILKSRFHEILTNDVLNAINNRIENFIQQSVNKINETSIDHLNDNYLLYLQKELLGYPSRDFPEFIQILQDSGIYLGFLEKSNLINSHKKFMDEIYAAFTKKIYDQLEERILIKIKDTIEIEYKENAKKPFSLMTKNNMLYEFKKIISHYPFHEKFFENKVKQYSIQANIFVEQKRKFERYMCLFSNLMDRDISLSFYFEKIIPLSDKELISNDNKLFVFNAITLNYLEDGNKNDFLVIEKLNEIYMNLIIFLKTEIKKSLNEVPYTNYNLRKTLAGLLGLTEYIHDGKLKFLPFIIPSSEVARKIDEYLIIAKIPPEIKNYSPTERLQDPLNNLFDIRDNQASVCFRLYDLLIALFKLDDNVKKNNKIMKNFISDVNLLVENIKSLTQNFPTDLANNFLELIKKYLKLTKSDAMISFFKKIEKKILVSTRVSEITLNDLKTILRWHFGMIDISSNEWNELCIKIPSISDVKNRRNEKFDKKQEIIQIRLLFENWMKTCNLLMPLTEKQIKLILSKLIFYINNNLSNKPQYEMNLSDSDKIWIGLIKKLSEKIDKTLLKPLCLNPGLLMFSDEIRESEKILPENRLQLVFTNDSFIMDLTLLKEIKNFFEKDNNFDVTTLKIDSRFHCFFSNEVLRNKVFNYIDYKPINMLSSSSSSSFFAKKTGSQIPKWESSLPTIFLEEDFPNSKNSKSLPFANNTNA